MCLTSYIFDKIASMSHLNINFKQSNVSPEKTSMFLQKPVSEILEGFDDREVTFNWNGIVRCRLVWPKSGQWQVLIFWKKL